MKGYAIQKTYVVICERCNEDITRPVSGEAPSTKAEAEDYAREHEQSFHADGVTR